MGCIEMASIRLDAGVALWHITMSKSYGDIGLHQHKNLTPSIANRIQRKRINQCGLVPAMSKYLPEVDSIRHLIALEARFRKS